MAADYRDAATGRNPGSLGDFLDADKGECLAGRETVRPAFFRSSDMAIVRCKECGKQIDLDYAGDKPNTLR